MTHTRGSKDDYDRWAQVTDDQGWSWDSLFPYMLKVKPSLHFYHSLPIYTSYLRWKELLNSSAIGTQQENSIRRCMGHPVRPLTKSPMMRNYPNLTM